MFEILPQLAFPTLPVSLLLLFYFYFGKKKVNLENNYKWVMTMVVRWEKEEKEKKMHGLCCYPIFYPYFW